MGDTYDKGFTFPRVGLGNVGSYQVGGIPFITGTIDGAEQAADTEIKVEFPFVTRSITVINLDSSNDTIYVHFNSNDASNTGGSTGVIAGSHFIPLDTKEDSLTMNVKCKEIYITTPASNSGTTKWKLFAELTHIPTKAMYQLTGSGLTDSQLD